jgi:hypothetical protein
VEQLERRELLSNVPTIMAVLPADGSKTINAQPSLVVTFSEDVQAGQANNAQNYLLFNAEGNPITIDQANYTNGGGAGPFQVTLSYNGGIALPADSYTLLIRGDQIHHNAADNLPLAQPGQLVVANSASHNVSFVNAPGDGTLQALTNYAGIASSAKPAGMAIADVNGDGFPDLVVINSGTDTVDIFDGLKGGGFSNTRSETLQLPAGAKANAVVVADFNGDQLPDIAVTDTGTSDVTVFLNQGNGVFGAGLQYAAGNNPVGLVAADFLQNGFLDLAVVNTTKSFPFAYHLSVLLADTLPSNRGKFLAPQSFAVPFLPRALATADFNHDNLPDLVIAGDGGVQTFYNTSSGGTLSFTANPLLTSTATTAVVAGNIDPDPVANPDIMATSAAMGGEVIIFQNSGTGVFNQPEIDVPIGALPTSIALADVNLDGLNDILLTTTKGNVNSLAVLINASIPDTPFFLNPVFYAVDSGPVALAVHTTAGGVVDEVATANAAGNDVSVLGGKSNGTFFASTEIAVGGAPKAVVVGDLNGDLLPDFVVASVPNVGPDVVSIFMNQGNGTYSAPVNVTVGNDSSNAPLSLALGHLNANTAGNLLDIVVTNPSDGTVTVILNNGDGTFTALAPTVVGQAPTSVVLGSFVNGGAPLGMVVAENGFPPQFPAPGVLFFAGNGDGTFAAPVQILSNVQVVAMATADFNKDGNLDVAVIDNQAVSTMTVLRGDGTGNFVAQAPLPVGPNATAIAVGDFNRDGFPDIVVTNHATQKNGSAIDSISVLLNNAEPGAANSFNAAISTQVLNNASGFFTSVSVTDVGEDLFPDLVLTTSAGPNNVITLQNIDGRGEFGLPEFHGAAGGGAAAPSVAAVISDPLIRATTFSVKSNFVTSDLIVNGTFESPDLSREAGNLTGWQVFAQPGSNGGEGSHGGWEVQSGTTAPLSALPQVNVPPPPQGQYAAMLDEPNPRNLAGNPLDYVFVPAAQASDYSGTHILYQDFLVPFNATKVTLSFSLFIDNTSAYSDPKLTPALDFFPGVANAPANQQVRVDIMDPNANIRDVGLGVLQNVFITSPTTPHVFGYSTITADLTAFAGKKVRLRFAEVNNQGKLIVGVDDIHVRAFYPESVVPSLNGIHLRNPGFGATVTFGGNSTDPTIVGQVGDIGSAANIAFIQFDPDNSNFAGPNVFQITAQTNGWDALGNFMTTVGTLTATGQYILPSGQTLLPGPITVDIRAVSKAGQVFATTFTFDYQGPSLVAWQAAGPGPIIGVGVYNPHGVSTVSGRVTAVAVDPRDATGNTFYVGSDNGGVWKTTDGGADYTPLTDFIVDPTLGSVPVPIGSVALDPSNPETVYAATGTATDDPESHAGVGILKSTDAGATWTVVGKNVFGGAKISKLVVSTNGKDHITRIYAAVASGGSFGPGVYRSTDGGMTWTDVLTTNVMQLDAGGIVAKGTALASVTDIAIDPLSQDGTEENVWIGLGNTGLLPVSTTAGVWFSNNHGDTWQQIVGGHDPKSALNIVRNQTIPPGPNATMTGIGRVTIALPTTRIGDEGIVYVMMGSAGASGTSLNPKATSLTSSDIGVYKTRNGGLSWTHVMLKELTFVSPTTILYQNLFTLGREADDIGALIVDPNNANVFYVGGAYRFTLAGDPVSPVEVGPFQIADVAHNFIRVDTSNMRDTEYHSPYYPNSPVPVYPNDGDDITKAGDAARRNSPFSEPGSYPSGNPYKLGGYQGEGVFWYDLQSTDQGGAAVGVSGASNQLPDSILSLAFDPTGRLLVGTQAGIWRGVTQSFVYDTTSGGVGIDAFLGTPTPFSAGMTLSDLNGNLQIADTTSVAIDPYNNNVLDSSQRDTGFARSTGGLGWLTTNDFTFDANPFAGTVRIGARDPNALPGTQATVYRDFNLVVDLTDQVEKSIDGGKTFSSAVTGLNLSDVFDSSALPLTIDPVKLPDQNGNLQDSLLFWTNKVNETDNNGDLWSPTTAGPFPGSVVTAMAFGPSVSDAFYVGTRNGKLFVDLNDGGNGFPERDSGLPAGFVINGITVDPTNDMIAYAMVDGLLQKNGHVFRTTNGGQSWTNITNNLQDVPAYSMAIDPRPGPNAPNGVLYVGTFTGVYFSTDNGQTWQRLGAVKNANGTTTFTLPNAPVLDIQLNKDFEKLLIAEEGRGVFQISVDRFGPRVVSISPPNPTNPGVSSITVTFNKPVDPRTFTLAQITNFVGPFGPITPLSITDVDKINHNVYTITFAPQFGDGTYSLTIGPGIRDFIGNLMDQDANGINGEATDAFNGLFVINTTDDGRFVSGVYNDLLNRPSDSASFASFLASVDAGRTPLLRQVATTFVSSPEARTLTISDIFNTYLGRAPSPTELSNLLMALQAGQTPEQILTGVLSSPEYFTHTGATDIGFINHIFQDALIRKIDAGTLNGFLFQAEITPRTTIANVLDQSTEYQANLVAGYYSRLLGRPASNSEIAARIMQFQQKATDEQIVANIIGSDEYFGKKGGTNSSWLTAAFNDILGRPANSAEQALFLGELTSGVSRETAALQLLSTQEYKTDLLENAVNTNPKPFFPTYLNRQPVAAEVASFTAALLNGVTDEAVISTLLASAENFQNNGTGSTQAVQDQNWFNTAFMTVLGRSPGAAGQAFLTFLSNAEQAERNVFSQAVPSSDEYFTKLITDVFIHYLQRVPGPAGISFWLPFVKQPSGGPGTPSPDEQFVATILSSSEYFADQKDPVSQLSTNTTWLTSLYQKLLRRVPDPGINTWHDFIENGYQAQRQAVATALDTSTEYRRDVIISYYKTYLRRSPTTTELNSLLGMFQTKLTDEQVINQLVSSVEYFQNPNLGASSNSVWLNQVYMDLLHRVRDPGSDGFLTALNNNTLTRAQVVTFLTKSSEYQAILVTRLFQTFLARPATNAELKQYLPALTGGLTDEQLISVLLSSSEYLDRPHAYP